MEIYHNVFDEYDFVQILKEVAEPKWRYGHGSYDPDDPNYDKAFPFWVMELDDNRFFTDYLLNIIREVVDEPELELEHVYANGHVYGDKAMPHVDSNYDDGRTFILYANRHWNALDGGETAFLNKDGETWTHVTPSPNKAVFFKGDRYHYAREVSRTFRSLRVTIAWKLNGATRKLHY